MSVTLKVAHKNMGRMIKCDKGSSTELPYLKLQEDIVAVFPDLQSKSFHLTRVDEDGDQVTVSSDFELTETVRIFQESTKPTKGSCPRFTVQIIADPSTSTQSQSGEKAAADSVSSTDDPDRVIDWSLPKYDQYRKLVPAFQMEKTLRDKMARDKEGFTPAQLDAFFEQFGKAAIASAKAATTTPAARQTPSTAAAASAAAQRQQAAAIIAAQSAAQPAASGAPYNPYADPNYKIPAAFNCVSSPINWNAAKYSKYRKLKSVLYEGGIRKRLKDDGFTNDEIEAYFQPWPGTADETTIWGALYKVAVGGVEAAPLAVDNTQYRHDAPKHHPPPPTYAVAEAVNGEWRPVQSQSGSGGQPR